ncbi:hypothetical protein OH491_00535 [Termitidicoccus mucosus]|uniref:Uncharacterized protein n=1 Tax=Termitidicoccus mucosus TaxID=1184151 RepID=A0A178IDX4_9BACT|nr:hypothetical protein AW736_24820 [Opitutaceae bacterium TSB47]
MAAQTHATLHLFRHAETAWREVARPWLANKDGGLRRSHVLVPTRGQAHGLKQRCLMEDVPLLGVEFLSPGLARKKWLARLELEGGAGGPAPRPAIGRELLLLGLRVIIERRLQPLSRDSLERGLLKSLQSDPERALDDFDELLRYECGGRPNPDDFRR